MILRAVRIAALREKEGISMQGTAIINHGQDGDEEGQGRGNDVQMHADTLDIIKGGHWDGDEDVISAK